jgi:hypothetical protein
MSSSPDYPTPAADHGYGGGGRTARPLFALIPIGIALFVVLAMLAEGPADAGAGESHVAQSAVPGSGPGAPS